MNKKFNILGLLLILGIGALIYPIFNKEEIKDCTQKYVVTETGGCDAHGYCGTVVEPFPDKTVGVGPDVKILQYPVKGYVVCEHQFISLKK